MGWFAVTSPAVDCDSFGPTRYVGCISGAFQLGGQKELAADGSPLAIPLLLAVGAHTRLGQSTDVRGRGRSVAP